MRKNDTLYRMTIAAMLMAIGMVLPRLLGGTEVLGQPISPLHIPALIAGLTLGGFWGGVVGFASPLLGHLALQAPPSLDKALPMAVECLAYGVISGILYALLLRLMKGKPRIIPLLAAQVTAMLVGRVVGGAGKALMMLVGLVSMDAGFTFQVFISSYFLSTAVGAVIHLIVVPAVVLALEKAKLSPLGRNAAA